MDNFKTTTEDEKKDKERQHGFKLTFGRCFDFCLIAINIIVFVFSFIACICICLLLVTSNAAVLNTDSSSSEACLLFATADEANDVIQFGSNSVCYFVLVSPLIVWCFLVFFILFLSLKICRAWDISFFEIILCGISIVCLVFVVIVTLTLTIGHSITCGNVAKLNIPDTEDKQSCSSGVVYYTAINALPFEGLLATAEITLWITCIVLVILSFIHFFRIVLFSRRSINKERMKAKLAIEEGRKKYQESQKVDEFVEKSSPT